MFRKLGSTVVTSQKGRKALEKEFFMAIEIGKIEDVKKCIKKGVDINVTDDEFTTALHITAEKGDVEIAKLLTAQKNIKINAQTKLGLTPLMIAVAFNRHAFTQMILRNGADPNIKNFQGKTALHIAVQKNYNIVVELLAYKAMVNIADSFDNTPLSLCIIEYPSRSTAKLLLKNGADPDFRTIRPHPVLLELCLNCRTFEKLYLVQLLLDFKADPNIRNELSKQTALHLVSITGYLPLARLLISMGADPELRDVSNRTPFDMAIEHGQEDLIAFYKKRKSMLAPSDDNVSKIKLQTESIVSMGSMKKRKSGKVKFTEVKSDVEESDSEIFIQQL